MQFGDEGQGSRLICETLTAIARFADMHCAAAIDKDCRTRVFTNCRAAESSRLVRYSYELGRFETWDPCPDRETLFRMFCRLLVISNFILGGGV